MTYLVESLSLALARPATRDLEILYQEKNAAESQAAGRWYNRFEVGFRRELWRAVIFVGRCKC